MQRSPENFVESLTLQQREIAETLAHMSEFAPAVKTVDTARKVAQTAANNLAQPNLPFAVASMRATQSALQNATKAARAGENPEPAALQDLARRQTRIKEMVEKLIESQKTAPAGALPRAARLMEQAAGEVGPLAAGKVPGLPASAKTALQSATSALANGAAQASAGQSQPAQGNAGTAAEALARAQAALAMAQAGLGSDAPSAGAGQSKGQGQSPGQGQAQGQGNGPGQGKGQGQAKGTPGQQGSGNANNAAGSGNADGPRGNVEGTGQFTGLPKRDRAALRQSQGEKYPQEYGPLVEQYLKNLSDNAGGK